MTQQSVLIIDDDPAIRDAFEMALEDEGYDIMLADSGEAGLQKAALQSPDMVFLDLRMPGIDGVETLRRLREMGVEAPVYIVTAFMPEFLDELSIAAKEGLVFGLGQKPLTGQQIRSIAKSNMFPMA